MNLNFTKTDIGKAENEEGAVVRSADKELLMYERGGFQVPVEINFASDEAIIFPPDLGDTTPADVSEEDILAEILAGAKVVARREVRWG